MSLYYLLLLIIPFHSDPRLGANLFTAGAMIVTPAKIVGLLAVFVALIMPRPEGAAPRLANPLAVLFVPFAIFPVLATLVFGLPIPVESVSALISAALLLMATRRLANTRERMFKVSRTLVLAFAFGSLWVYKQHFIGHAISAWGLEQEPNYEALMLLTSIPLGFWMARHEARRWWRRIGLGCGLIQIGAIVLTESRAGIFAAGFMGIAAVIHSRRKIAGLALIAVAAFLLFDFGPTNLSHRFESIKLFGTPTNGDEASTRIHIELLKAGLNMIAAHPMFGVGLGEFKAMAPVYNAELLKLTKQSYVAHDTFIQIGAEGGMPTLFLFLAMMSTAIVNFKSVRPSSDTALAALAFSMQIGLMGISIAAVSITAQLLPFWIFIFLSQNLREIAVADVRQGCNWTTAVSKVRPATSGSGDFRPNPIVSASSSR